MKSGALFTIVALVVVVTLAGQFASGLGAGTFNPGSPVVRVYGLWPGTSGVIWVNFQFDGPGNFTFSPPSRLFCVYRGSSDEVCPGLLVTSSVDGTMSHAAGQSVTVAFTLTAEMNATAGHYLLDFGQCGAPFIPVVIGAAPASAWFGLGLCLPTPPGLGGVAVVGYSGFLVADVPYGPTCAYF